MTRQKKMCWKEYYSYDTVCRSLINPLNCARGRHFSGCLIIYNLSLSSSRNSDGFFTLSHCVSSILSLSSFSLSVVRHAPSHNWAERRRPESSHWFIIVDGFVRQRSILIIVLILVVLESRWPTWGGLQSGKANADGHGQEPTEQRL